MESPTEQPPLSQENVDVEIKTSAHLIEEPENINLPKPENVNSKTSRLSILRSRLKSLRPADMSNHQQADNGAGVVQSSGKEDDIVILKGTFPRPDVFDFNTKGLSAVRRIAGVDRLSIRSAPLPRENKEGIKINEPNNTEKRDFSIVIDASRMNRGEISDKEYAKMLNTVLKSAVHTLSIKSQLGKLKTETLIDSDRAGSWFKGISFEEAIKKITIVLGTSAPMFGVVAAVIPGLASRAIEGSIQMRLGIPGIVLPQLPASLISLTGGIFLGELYNFCTTKTDIPDYAPVLFHRIAFTDLFLQFTSLVKKRSKD